MRFQFEDLAYDLTTLPDEPTANQFMMLKREALEQLEFTRMKWQCQGKGCTNGTHVRDYGIEGWYFLDRNSKESFRRPTKYWYFVNERFWMCGRHWKMWERLKKSGFAEEHIARRLMDWSKPRLVDIK